MIARVPGARTDPGGATPMQMDAYLRRLAYDGPREPSAETLRRIHRAHMLAVPFENLDIHLGVPIVLSASAIYEKIVTRRRGGFCYELNGLFAWLLAEIGFRVTLHSGRVFSGERLGPEFDHLVLVVDLGDAWVADVGFGDSFLEPLRVDSGIENEQQGWRYSIVEADEGWVMRRGRPGGAWEPQYAFSSRARRLEEFAGMCAYHQTSPESHFTRKTVCSLATVEGRVTLSNGRLIHTQGERRAERPVRTVEECRTILAKDFGMEVTSMAVERLVPAMRAD
jgi:N-hydroxyarylamine O-acetyltransferase